MANESKLCTKCKEIKPLSEFIWDSHKNTFTSWCRKCRAVSSKTYRDKNPKTEKKLKQINERTRKWRRERREKVIERLGKMCITCGYDKDIRALHIDHKNGDGSWDRKRFKSFDVYVTYLLGLNMDELNEDYQCLCANCNWIKRYEEMSFN
jgi:hypothetical protein